MHTNKYNRDVKVRGADSDSMWPAPETLPVQTWAEEHYDAAVVLIELPGGARACVELTTDDVVELARQARQAATARGETPKRLTRPIVHLNGTGIASLREQLSGAYLAIGAAQEALRNAAPNGRDYYLKPGSFELAREEHRDRDRRLESVKDELTDLAHGLDALLEVS